MRMSAGGGLRGQSTGLLSQHPSVATGAGSHSTAVRYRLRRLERPGARIACRQSRLWLTVCLIYVWSCIRHISYAGHTWPVLRHRKLVCIVANTCRCLPYLSFLHGEKGGRTQIAIVLKAVSATRPLFKVIVSPCCVLSFILFQEQRSVFLA